MADQLTRHSPWLLAAVALLPSRLAAAPVPVEQDVSGPFVTRLTVNAAAGWREGGLTLWLNRRDDANHLSLRVAPNGAVLVRALNGRRTTLADVRVPLVRPGESAEISVRRDSWAIAVMVNGRRVGLGHEADLADGAVSYEVDGGQLSVTKARVQLLEPIFFTDDFMRPGDQSGGWKTVSGQWRQTGAEASKFNAARSANPFCYRSTEAVRSVATTGYWFWHNYLVEAAVRGDGRGALGLHAYHLDDRNHLELRWAPLNERTGEGRLQLLETVGGQARTLAATDSGYLPNQWYRLGLLATDEGLEAFVDGHSVLKSDTPPRLGQGQIGLLTEGCAEARFDDIRVASALSFVDDFSNGMGNWRVLAGSWKAEKNAAAAYAGRGTAVATAGGRDWSDCQVTARWQRPSRGAAGVAARCQGEGNRYEFRVTQGGEARLLRVVDGEAVVLGRGRVGGRLGPAVEISLDASGPLLTGRVGEEVACRVFDGRFESGSAGLCTDGPDRLLCSEVRVLHVPPPPRRPSVTPQFTKEDTMAEWAQTRSDWVAGGDGVHWFQGVVFGDCAIQFPSPQLGKNGGQVTLALAADGNTTDSGYELALAKAGDEACRLSLSRRGRQLAERTIPKPEKDAPIRVEQLGGALGAFVDDELILSTWDPQPLIGRHVACRRQDATLELSAIWVDARNCLDETFSHAPSEWRPERGEWEVTERWTCSPDWSFFGGFDSPTPVLWSKESFDGDQVVEAFLGVRMHDKGYDRPGDLNVTLCANGAEVSSGYSFILSGWNDQATRLMRNGQPVAEAEFKFPTGGKFKEKFHRHWFHVRIEKLGQKLRYSLDGQQLLEYTDPQPLTGGKVAVWTLDKGILLARSRVWYERLGEWQPRPRPLPASDLRDPREWLTAQKVWSLTHPSAGNDFDAVLGEAVSFNDADAALRLETDPAADRHALRLLNRVSGGQFGARLLGVPVDARELPVLSFDYRAAPGVALDLIVRANGKELGVAFTGGEVSGGVDSLGAVAGAAADGRWHTARFDLGPALERKLETDDPIMIESLTLEKRVRDNPYYRVGFGGVGFGADLWVDDFVLSRAGGPTAQFQWTDRDGDVPFVSYFTSVDQDANGEARKGREQRESLATFTGLRPGTWYLHVLAKSPDGRWRELVDHRFTVEAQPATDAALLKRGFLGPLKAEYFDGPDIAGNDANAAPPEPTFENAVLTRDEPTLNYVWKGSRPPVPALGSEYWSGRWRGTFQVPREGAYTFALQQLDDAGRLTIDGRTVVDAWAIQPMADHESQPVQLTRGEHSFTLEYHQGPGPGASIRLAWKGPELDYTPLSFDAEAEYFSDPDHLQFEVGKPPEGPCFSQSVLKRRERSLDCNWCDVPSPALGDVNWSARWTGKLFAPKEGDYTFFLEALDDAGRVYLDDEKILDAWALQPPGTHASEPQHLTAGEHSIRVEYYQGHMASSIRLSWRSQEIPKEPIPACVR